MISTYFNKIKNLNKIFIGKIKKILKMIQNNDLISLDKILIK